ncbi:MAG: hypothetical protein DSZ29_01775, partial [Aquificaceae bacterium]
GSGESDYPVSFPILKESASSYSTNIKVTNTTGTSATVFAWIDFNKNGVFDANEATTAVANDGLENESVTLTWNTIPNDIKIGTTYIRLRITTDSAVNVAAPSNKANNGEVEDYIIAIAQDVPPDSPNVTVLTGLDPQPCEQVVFYDNFDGTNFSSSSDAPAPALNAGIYLGEHRSGHSSIRNWTVTGGGSKTYARTVELSPSYAATLGYNIANYGTSVYLGNGAVRRVYPPITTDHLVFDDRNRLLTPIEAVEIRDAPDDLTPTNDDQSHWGPEAVKLSRTFPSEPGKVYRLFFKALPELGDFNSGIIRVDTPSGSVHVKTPGNVDDGVTKFAIEFTATSTTSTISFVNYGHIGANSGGWCAQTSSAWCTVGGLLDNANEVTLDDIMVTESSCTQVCDINGATTGIYSSASVQSNSKRLNNSTRLYQAQFDAERWDGYLLSYDLKTANNNNNGNTKNLKWDAAEQLPSYEQRNIFSYNPLATSSNKGIAFAWDNLNTNQKTLLQTVVASGGSSASCDGIAEWVNNIDYANGTIVKHQNIRYKVVRADGVAWKDPSVANNNIANVTWGWWETLGACSGGSSSTPPQNILAWVRGDQSEEKTVANASGIYRHRVRLLGDIIHSSPVYAGKYDSFGYVKLAGTEGSSYANFLTTKRSRTPIVYVGANDGMLHAFDANTGEEQFAYIPNEVIPKLKAISDIKYGCQESDCLPHEALVDGELTVGDAYIGNTWHSILLGTLGAGGKGIFALNVDNPDNFSSSDILWELSANQSPDPDTSNTSVYSDHLGNTVPQPSIVRLNNGAWAAVISNGYDSANHQAVLLLIDISNGHLIKAINTEKGTASEPNGLSSPIPIDTNRDRITDFIYAGDLQGNLWKFDVSNSNPDNWVVAYMTSSTPAVPAPLFTACETNTCSRHQAITAKPQVGKHPKGGYMVYFGTGKYADPSDNVSGTPDIETLYGIRDNGSVVASLDNLVQQTVLQESHEASDLNTRVLSHNLVDYTTDKGWYLKLLKADGTKEGERIISQALLRGGRLILTTLIPPENCGWNGKSWLMEINAINGRQLPVAVLDINNDRKINHSDKVDYNNQSAAPSGVQKPSIGMVLHSPVIINHTSSTEGKYVNGSNGGIGMFRESTSKASGRLSWRQIR